MRKKVGEESGGRSKPLSLHSSHVHELWNPPNPCFRPSQTMERNDTWVGRIWVWSIGHMIVLCSFNFKTLGSYVYVSSWASTLHLKTPRVQALAQLHAGRGHWRRIRVGGSELILISCNNWSGSRWCCWCRRKSTSKIHGTIVVCWTLSKHYVKEKSKSEKFV